MVETIAVPDTSALINSIISNLVTTITSLMPLIALAAVVIISIIVYKKYAAKKVSGR